MMLNRLALACSAGLLACSTTFVDPVPTRDLAVRVFNGSTMTMSNIRVNGGLVDVFSRVNSLEHGDLSNVITVKSTGAPLTVVIDVSTPAKRALSASVPLLSEAQSSPSTVAMVLTLRFEGEPARLIAELSQPVED